MDSKDIVRKMGFFLLKFVGILLITTLVFVGGLMLGYGILGGGEPTNILKSEVWQQIYNYFIP
ncbi:DNA-directed RNA polymerase subunit beta [Lacticigenium naphthae]|uniref:DNA-directed RNA polymerase subunit beta n=1 Tax=Lacticigenium naphthae TaxID=515351 RepID=UPI0004037DFB|nr:DNA-directed RNA polymerase subunit beta [Lacticigenium naphthae]